LIIIAKATAKAKKINLKSENQIILINRRDCLKKAMLSKNDDGDGDDENDGKNEQPQMKE